MAANNYQPVAWRNGRAIILDQTLLPHEEKYLSFNDYLDICDAIKTLKVRGAPAIGIAGAYAVALGASSIDSSNRVDFLKKLHKIIDTIAATRPTARNLFFTLERMETASLTAKSTTDIKKILIGEAKKIHKEEAEATRRLTENGAALIKDGWTILTHCNTGPLAAPDSGTALGVIAAAQRQGKKVQVIADETRPLLQGARLTTWECLKIGLPVTLITDNMAGSFMRRGKVDCVITGADRITANGDTANKIGTYMTAVLAKENGIPFYIAAPTSTIDTSLKTGEDIPIEERDQKEVTHWRGIAIAPEGINAANPAFDVTPNRYISAIITEKGVIKAPYAKSIITLTE
jgi:methylthioribose-1-phosphate isomerase